MYRTTLARAVMVASILLMSCLSNSTFAAPIIPNLNHFFAGPSVTVAGDGSSALIAEDPFSSVAFLSNQPSLGDPNVIIPAVGTTLSFDYDFSLGLSNNDEFRVNLFNTDTYLSAPPLTGFEFFTSQAGSGSVSFDLTSLAGLNLGLDFELRSFDNLLDSTVTISNMRLGPATIAPIPEPLTIYSFLLGGLLLLLIKRRHK